MHESTKLAKLKEINRQQERLLNRSIIEEQMEVERHRKAVSREGRREKTNLSIGPQMTDEVFNFGKMKATHDVEKLRETLLEQMKEGKTHEI